MTEYDATEQAFTNGYQKALYDFQLVDYYTDKIVKELLKHKYLYLLYLKKAYASMGMTIELRQSRDLRKINKN